MDKPLSQERLSEEELQKCISFISIELEPPDQKRLQVIVAEVKRLQAIESHQKKVIEFCTTNLTAYGLKSIANEAMKMLEGADSIE